MRKMVQFSHRIIQFILLCWIWILADAVSWGAEHSSVGIHKKNNIISREDLGEITLFLLYVAINEVAKKLDSSYVCPVYCGVNHKHRIKEDEAKAKEESDKKADIRLHRSVVNANRKQ